MGVSLSHLPEATQGSVNPAKDFLPAGLDAARRIATDRRGATEAGRYRRVADAVGPPPPFVSMLEGN